MSSKVIAFSKIQIEKSTRIIIYQNIGISDIRYYNVETLVQGFLELEISEI